MLFTRARRQRAGMSYNSGALETDTSSNPDPGPDLGTGSTPSPDDMSPAPRRPRALTAVLVVLALLLAAGGAAVFAMPKGTSPGTPLGAAASVPGGLARVNGILPLEVDGWQPPDGSTVLDQPAARGTHRVRILLELTATESRGIEFSSADYSITGLGSGEPPLLWAEPASANLAQGQSTTATLVFEIPNQAVELSLEGPSGTLLALGVGHHTPGS
jgi:hypothetical protein